MGTLLFQHALIIFSFLFSLITCAPYNFKPSDWSLSMHDDEEEFFDAEEGEEEASKANLVKTMKSVHINDNVGDESKTRSSSSPSSNSDLSIIQSNIADNDAPLRLSNYRFREGSVHPLAQLSQNNRLSTGTSISEDSVSDSEMTMSPSLNSSIGALSAALSVLTNNSQILRPKKIKVKLKRKTFCEFSNLYLIQELSLNAKPTTDLSRSNSQLGRSDSFKNGSVSGANAPSLYTAQFSHEGNYLAVAGEDHCIRIWKVLIEDTMLLISEDKNYQPPKTSAIFNSEPIQILEGHDASIVDLCWSRNNFLLSASMDKSVRLWHYSRNDCLGVFRHQDFVTSVAFHPRDDRLFLTGSLDCRLRVWSIAEKAVKVWNELPSGNYVTAVTFSPDGNVIYAGTHTGVCLIFDTEGLKYTSQIHVHSRRGKNKIGKKICGITSLPGAGKDVKILISSNDSRLRLYTLRDKSVVAKFIGLKNESSQIKAQFSDDGEYVIAGSEDRKVFIWNVENRYKQRKLFSTTPSHHVKSCEYFRAHSSSVTCAIFAPSSIRNRLQSVGLRPVLGNQVEDGHIIVAIDLNGHIKVYENNSKLEQWLLE